MSEVLGESEVKDIVTGVQPQRLEGDAIDTAIIPPRGRDIDESDEKIVRTAAPTEAAEAQDKEPAR